MRLRPAGAAGVSTSTFHIAFVRYRSRVNGRRARTFPQRFLRRIALTSSCYD